MHFNNAAKIYIPMQGEEIPFKIYIQTSINVIWMTILVGDDKKKEVENLRSAFNLRSL